MPPPIEDSSLLIPRRPVSSHSAEAPPPPPEWYERLQPEGWQLLLAVKIAVVVLVIRWLHRKGWLALAARFARANWAQVIGLLLLGFIALKLGGVDFPGWRAVLGLPPLPPPLLVQ